MADILWKTKFEPENKPVKHSQIQEKPTDKKTDKNRLLTVDELSELLCIKKSMVYSYTCQGILPHYKIGRYLRFKETEVMGWLEKKRVSAE